ncbi:T9SS type A sorting domain-containing protein [Flavobacterium hauense]
MKKQLLTGAFLLASFFAVQAQETIYTQPFDVYGDVFPTDESLPTWDSFSTDGDTAFFTVYQTDADLLALGLSGAGTAGSANFTVTGTAPNQQIVMTEGSDNLLVSVPLEFPADAPAYATFKAVALGNANATPAYDVIALTSDDLTAMAAATTLEEFAAALDAAAVLLTVTNVSKTEAELKNVDLADYAGETILLGFRHHNSGTLPAYLFIDDLTVATGVAGVNENVLASLSVYPNPTSDVVNVAVDALVSNVAIADLNGRTVKSVKFDGVSNASVNVSDLASGIYMMTVSSDKGTTTKKIVKN